MFDKYGTQIDLYGTNTINMESNLRRYHFDDAYQEYQAAKDAVAELAAQRRPLKARP